MITYNKTIANSNRLSDQIREDNWVDEDTIVVCVDPINSGILSQVLSNNLSSNPLDQIIMYTPLDNSQMVFDHTAYKRFIEYSLDYVGSMTRQCKYLFTTQSISSYNDKAFKRIMQLCSIKQLDVKYASLYLDSDIFLPDYYYELNKSINYEWTNK